MPRGMFNDRSRRARPLLPPAARSRFAAAASALTIALTVASADLTTAKARVLDRLFGASRIVLQGLSRSQALQPSANRVDDHAPWNGGDNITSHQTGCISGAGVTYPGARR